MESTDLAGKKVIYGEKYPDGFDSAGTLGYKLIRCSGS